MSKRPNMLASVIREKIAPLIRECPQSCGMVSITELKVAPDGGAVTVYVSALSNLDDAVIFLRTQIPRMRGLLSTLELRRIPDIFIRPDRTGEQAARVEQLLKDPE